MYDKQDFDILGGQLALDVMAVTASWGTTGCMINVYLMGGYGYWALIVWQVGVMIRTRYITEKEEMVYNR